MLNRLLPKTLPYMVLGIMIFSLTTIFGSDDAAPFFFALLGFVFVLWRPQIRRQLVLAYTIAGFLFVLPAFSANNTFFMDYFGSDSYRYDCFENALCMNVAMFVPYAVRFVFGGRLWRRDEASLPAGRFRSHKLSISEMLFVTLCFALLASFARSIANNFTGGFREPEEYLRWMRAVTPPELVLTLATSVTSILCMLAFSSNRIGVAGCSIAIIAIIAVLAVTPVLIAVSSGNYDAFNSESPRFSRFWEDAILGCIVLISISVVFTTLLKLLRFKIAFDKYG